MALYNRLDLDRAKLSFRAAAVMAGARMTDIVLVGLGLTTAAGSATFAGVMLMRVDNAPSVNGLEYLSIFAKPNGSSRVVAEAKAPSTPKVDTNIDWSPVGSVAPPRPTANPDYALVGVRGDLAWVRRGTQILALRPGDELPGLGRVSAIVKRGGRWVVSAAGGTALLSMDAASADPIASAAPSFSRAMIFGGK